MLLLLLVGTGCQSGYYLHLAKGQWELSRQAKSFAWWHEQQPQVERDQKLQQTLATLAFAEAELGFDTGKLYLRYAELDRPYVVWVITATQPFSFAPYQWCYLLIGCAPYRGFFTFERLQQEKHKLEARGYEVYVSGVQAYSTLGWLRDPLTNLMLQGDRWDNAELLLHELTHAHYYRKGDTVFNESLATAVARLAVSQWLRKLDEPSTPAREQLWQQQDADLQQVVQLVQQARAELESLYASELAAPLMRQQQQKIREKLRGNYRQAVLISPTLAIYQPWFDEPLSNAQLNLMHFYQGQVSRFTTLYQEVGGRWPAFWEAVRQLPTGETEND